MEGLKYQVEYVETMPPREEMQEGIIYVSEKYGVAIHLCACGTCGNQTVTSLQPFWESGWQFTKHEDGTISLWPSIGNFQFPCRSHYFFTRCEIKWC